MQSTLNLTQAQAGLPPAGRDTASRADCIGAAEHHSLHLTSLMAMAELKRLRRMRQTRKSQCPQKLAKFWLKLRSRVMRHEWIRGRRHWFGGAPCFESIVTAGLAKFLQNQLTFKARYIDFQDDIDALKVTADLPVTGTGFEIVQSNVA